jgi:hypothetical protein
MILSPLNTSPKFNAMLEPEMSPVPGRCLPDGAHTNGNSEYAYWICVLSL